ncbi:unnamed protein product [Cunninghamella blakesleeana]
MSSRLGKIINIAADILPEYIKSQTYANYKHSAFIFKAYKWKDIPKNLHPEEDFRATFIVTKKNVSKLAVIRKKCKRRVRDAVREVFPATQAPKGFDYIFLIQPSAYNMNWKELCKSVENAVNIVQKAKKKKSN